MFKLFTFAVVKKLLREDWYVKHSSVFPFCIFLFIHRDSKRIRWRVEIFSYAGMTARGGHLSSWTVGGWLIDFIPGHRGNTVIQWEEAEVISVLLRYQRPWNAFHNSSSRTKKKLLLPHFLTWWNVCWVLFPLKSRGKTIVFPQEC